MVTTTDALAEAAELARYAPSILNSQPWRWRVRGDVLDLYLAANRVPAVSDPDGRLAVLSCGAALHHARTALAAEGLDVTVARMPDDADPDHLARVTVAGQLPVRPEAVRRVQTIAVRHTDRRPVTAQPVSPLELAAVTAAVETAGVRIHVLQRDDVIEVAAAASYAQRVQAADEAWQGELAYWTGGVRDTTGVPDDVIPASPTQTTVPSRDFGHPGTLTVSAEHDRGAVFGVLYGAEEERGDWLRAGEALSSAWLAAIEAGLSLVPLSATIEVPYTRESLGRVLGGTGRPYLVLRLGHADPDQPGPAHTPRLEPEQIVERQ